jgi:hypothetical protein
MPTATFLRKLDGFTGEARLYRLSEPVDYEARDTKGYVRRSTYYVVVSAADAPYSGPETYIFPADPHGIVLSWSELRGSYRGGKDHAQALADAGYTVED